MLKLGVNIDHVATLREARYHGRVRGEPDPIEAALICEAAGAHGITAHLREDRRHIQDRDIIKLRQVVKTRLNLEMANTPEIVAVALRLRPDVVCLVPERRRLYANLTVRENLLMGAYLRKDKPGIAHDLEEMYQLFPILRERVKQYAGTLSGGEQQMLAIARGLMGRPRLLLLDEPSLGLAPLMVQHMFKTIREINQRGVTVLLVAHDINPLLTVTDRVIYIARGRTAIGKPEEVITSQSLSQLYGSPVEVVHAQDRYFVLGAEV